MLTHDNEDKEKLEEYLRQAKEYSALQQTMTDTQIKQGEGRDAISNLEDQIEIEKNRVTRLQNNLDSLDTKEVDANIKKLKKVEKKMDRKIKKFRQLSQTKVEKFKGDDFVLFFSFGILGAFLSASLAVVICLSLLFFNVVIEEEILADTCINVFIIGGIIGTALLPLEAFINKFKRNFLYTEKRIKSKQAKFERKSRKFQKYLSSNSNALAAKQNLNKEINEALSTIEKLEDIISSYKKNDRNYTDKMLDIQARMNKVYVSLTLMAIELKGQGLDVPSVFDEEPQVSDETTIEEPETFDIESTETEERPKIKKRGKFEGPKNPKFGIDNKNNSLFL